MAIQDNRPIYLQIANMLMDRIVSEQYPTDTRIPSVRDVAASAQVNVNTVVRSFEWLERHGIIYNRRGLGYFTAENAARTIADHRREEFFAGEVDYFFERLRQIGMSPAELSRRYETYIAKKQNHDNA